MAELLPGRFIFCLVVAIIEKKKESLRDETFQFRKIANWMVNGGGIIS